jgi:hypothetical protein
MSKRPLSFLLLKVKELLCGKQKFQALFTPLLKHLIQTLFSIPRSGKLQSPHHFSSGHVIAC